MILKDSKGFQLTKGINILDWTAQIFAVDTVRRCLFSYLTVCSVRWEMLYKLWRRGQSAFLYLINHPCFCHFNFSQLFLTLVFSILQNINCYLIDNNGFILVAEDYTLVRHWHTKNQMIFCNSLFKGSHSYHFRMCFLLIVHSRYRIVLSAYHKRGRTWASYSITHPSVCIPVPPPTKASYCESTLCPLKIQGWRCLCC